MHLSQAVNFSVHMSSRSASRFLTWRNSGESQSPLNAPRPRRPRLGPLFCPWGMRKRSPCGNLTGIHWAGWMHSASCHQRPPLSPPSAIVPIVTRNQTHKRKAFNWVYSWVLSSPTAHDWMLEIAGLLFFFFSSYFASQSTVPAHIQGFVKISVQ